MRTSLRPEPGLRLRIIPVILLPVILLPVLLLTVLFLVKRGQWSLRWCLSQNHETPVGS